MPRNMTRSASNADPTRDLVVVDDDERPRNLALPKRLRIADPVRDLVVIDDDERPRNLALPKRLRIADPVRDSVVIDDDECPRNLARPKHLRVANNAAIVPAEMEPLMEYLTFPLQDGGMRLSYSHLI